MSSNISSYGVGGKAVYFRYLQVEHVVFYILATLAVSSAVLVVLQKRAVYSALSLIVCLAAVAGLFFQLGSQFIAAIQVIVYAGAIMVLFVFVIMLLDPESEFFKGKGLQQLSYWAIPLAIFFALLLLQAFPDFIKSAQEASRETPVQGSVQDVGRLLFREYVLPFEVTSILILVAILGAVVLTKRDD